MKIFNKLITILDKNSYYQKLKTNIFLKNLYKIHQTNSSFLYILFSFFIASLFLKENINSLFMIILASYATFNFKSFSKKKFTIFLPLILYFIWISISLIYSKNLEIGLNKVMFFSPLVIFPFVF